MCHIIVADIATTMRTGVEAKPTVLIADQDRPTDLALVKNRLFVAISSPRRPVLTAFELDTGERWRKKVFCDWTHKLNGWRQLGFKPLVIGHMSVAEGNWVALGAGNTIEVFDGSENWEENGAVVHRLEVGRAPGPQSLTTSERNEIYIVTGSRVMKVDINASGS